MILTPNDLISAIEAWRAHCAKDPDIALRRLRQSAFFFRLKSKDGAEFAPLRPLIAAAKGIPFAQNGGRSVHENDVAESLLSLGATRVAEGDPEFDSVHAEWESACLATGKPLASYIGSNPRTGRVFWKLPSHFA